MRSFHKVEDQIVNVADTLILLRKARCATFPAMQPGSAWECLYHATIHQIAALARELQDWNDIERMIVELRQSKQDNEKCAAARRMGGQR